MRKNLIQKKDCKLKKAYKTDNSVYKISVGTVRLGVTYDNISNVQEKRENGILPEERVESEAKIFPQDVILCVRHEQIFVNK